MKIIRLLSCFVAITTITQAAPMYFPNTGHYYDFVTGFQTWSSANIAATASSYLGATGHLATIADASENAFLATTFADTGWIGLVKDPAVSVPSSGWSWVTGEPFAYANWNDGEPNNNTVQGPENRGEFYSSGTWNDLNENPAGNGINGYFVEYEVVPEPASLSLLGIGLITLAWRRRNRFAQPRPTRLQ